MASEAVPWWQVPGALAQSEDLQEVSPGCGSFVERWSSQTTCSSSSETHELHLATPSLSLYPPATWRLSGHFQGGGNGVDFTRFESYSFTAWELRVSLG